MSTADSFTADSLTDIRVVCLCAAWCGVCREFDPAFTALAQSHPHASFHWVDVEDQADWVDALEVDNFPTLLIQHEDNVAFFGTVLPDGGLAHRMVQAQQALGAEELARLSTSTQERRDWQRDCNLRNMLAATLAQ